MVIIEKLQQGKAKLIAHVGLISRMLAATLGGYALAHTVPVAFMAAFALPRGEAALAAIQLSFLVYLLAVIWCFAASTPLRAWLGVLVPALVSGLLGWALL